MGSATIVGNPALIGSEGRTIDVTFDLTGEPVGSYALVIINPDGSSLTGSGAFTVQEAGGPEIKANIVAPQRIATGHGPVSFYVQVSNTGNTDALGVVVSLYGIPSDAILKPIFDISPVPATAGQQSLDFSNFPFAPLVGQEQIPSLLIPNISPGSSVTLPFTLAVNSLPPISPLQPTPPHVLTPLTGSGPSINITAVLTTLDKFCNGGDGSCVLAALRSVALGGLNPLQSCLADLFCFNINALLNQNRFVHGGVFNLGEFILQELANAGPSCSVFIAAALLGLAANAPAVVVATAIATAITLILGDCVQTLDEGESQSAITASFDPNDKEGILGAGSSRWVSANQPLLYSVYFLNEATATAAAQRVVVTDVLDPSIDLSTVKVNGAVIGGLNVPIPPSFDPAVGQNQTNSVVDFRPVQSLIVSVNTSLNPVSRTLSWMLTAIDPATGLAPADPAVGVVPPGVEGSITYSVESLKTVVTGTHVRNQAVIVFDTNPSMTTPAWSNTIDGTPPRSSILSLPSVESLGEFTLAWSGTDDGSGIQNFTVFVSDNGGPFTAWLNNTTAISAKYVGELGHTYAFYSISLDLVGNVESAKTTAEATTQVVSQLAGDVNGDGKVDCADLAIVKSSFGKRAGQLGFDSRADLDVNGIVDIRDLALVARNLPAGTKCQ
jgi:hypothetical protein